MAALLSIPLEIALGKVAKVIEGQIQLFAAATDDLRHICNTLTSIKAVLVDAERKQITDESVGVWLSTLKGIALDIEDVVDEWQISSAGSDGDDESKAGNTWLPSILTHFKQSRRKIAVRVKEIRERLDKIHGDRLVSSFSSSGGGQSETKGVSSDWRQSSSLVEESKIIGRDKDKETVINWLVSDAEDGQRQQEEEVHVIAIVGIGGLGKTTLAQQIFNDPKVKDHFKEALYWVCVSDTFNVIKLIKDILEAVNGCEGGASSSTQLNVLQNNLLRSLKGKRFLLVLDDVWNEDDEKWETLQLSLRNGVQGSRILVTTRIKKVAEIMNASSCVHELKGLSDDLSWELFCRRAFPRKKPEEFLLFESIGRKIVKKCIGVPLSIKVMGSMMKQKTTMADWQNILESEMWSLPDVKGGILPSLQLSYHNLPPHLKQCFAYCSIYQKDAKMFKHELVNLWAAQGFIQPEGYREVDDIGEDYFDGLVARSMFQEIHEDYEGIITCKMHDLLHDLATVISQDESYIFNASKKSIPQRSSIGGVRHASFYNASISCPRNKLRTLFLQEIRVDCDKLFSETSFLRALVVEGCEGMKGLPEAIGELKHLRYLNLSGNRIVELPQKTIERLNLLRYLRLHDSSIYKLPDAFDKMEQLRYLDLSGTAIEELPESVSHLVNLHTLNLGWCESLKKLCGGISKIVGLRHLYINGTHELHFLPKGMGKLTSLQSLSKFVVGGENGEYCGIDELQELNSIRGCLRIEGLDRVSDAEQATRAQLCRKQYVRELVLDISSGERDAEDDKEEERKKVLECLRPHPNLQDLSLEGHSFSKLTLPSWMGDPSFSYLSNIYIGGFKRLEISTMPGLGKLPGLKLLEIIGVGVRKLGDEFYYGVGNGVGRRNGVAFPNLESLTLQFMEELEEWELTGEADASKVMPSLRELKVSKCPKLQLLPAHLASTPSSFSSSEVVEESENYCGELKPLPPDPDHGLIPLERLEIFQCRKLQALPHFLGQLKKLQSLEIWSAEELTGLPDSLGELESLEKLEIRSCNKLKSLPDSLGGLKKLKSLVISNVTELESIPDSLRQLESLVDLKIGGYYKWESLFQSLGGLKKLHISAAQELESLPDTLGQLTSLESLEIHECNKLKLLPDSLGRLHRLKSLTIMRCKELLSLPDSLQQLPLLQELTIHECPRLKYKYHGPRMLRARPAADPNEIYVDSRRRRRRIH